LASEHSAGEQLTPNSFARNQVAAVSPDYLVTSVRLPSQHWSGAVRITMHRDGDHRVFRGLYFVERW
ncbi:MAG: hypothetical protein RIR87_1755, partial [Actinomycetota bacterium]